MSIAHLSVIFRLLSVFYTNAARFAMTLNTDPGHGGFDLFRVSSSYQFSGRRGQPETGPVRTISSYKVQIADLRLNRNMKLLQSLLLSHRFFTHCFLLVRIAQVTAVDAGSQRTGQFVRGFVPSSGKFFTLFA
jgi:hypothetical protein